MPTSAPPCPQAARAPGYEPPPLGPMENIVTDEPVMPLPVNFVEALPDALVDQSITWPYHLPSFNGVDCLWWAMLVRAMYASDSTWLNRVAGWAGPVRRLFFRPRTDPSLQGYGFVELVDSVLVVIPGTSSEAEALAYFLTHSMRVLTTTAAGWKINATWATRGHQVVNGYAAWPPPSPEKPVIVIGHSSGGAYGAYFTYFRFSDPATPYTLATYGAPIWGTPSLTARYNNSGQLPKCIDFAVPQDPVPALPPPWAAVDLVLPLYYALTDRPNYQRVNALLTLQGITAPTPSTQPTTLDAIISVVRTLLAGGALDSKHSTANYTSQADTWAANDPSIAANRLRPAYTALKAILVDMDAAGLY